MTTKINLSGGQYSQFTYFDFCIHLVYSDDNSGYAFKNLLKQLNEIKGKTTFLDATTLRLCEVISAGGTGANRRLVKLLDLFVPTFKLALVSNKQIINSLKFISINLL